MSTTDPTDRELAELTRQMMRAGASEAPSAEVRQRAVLAVRTATAAGAAGLSFTWKVALLAVVAAGIVGGGLLLALRSGSSPAPLEATGAGVAPVPSVVVSSEPPAASPPPSVAEAESAPAEPVASAPRVAAPSARAKEPSLAMETARIAEAHAKLGAGDAAGCLAVLDRYQRDFPRGRLSQEALVVRIQALLARGDRASAEALGRRFLAANPSSPYAARVRSLLGLTPPKSGAGDDKNP